MRDNGNMGAFETMQLLASIPTDVAVDNATIKKIVTYSSLLKRESAFLAELKTILEKM